MKLGTRSLLFGCHQFVLHPLYVLYAWVKLYRQWPDYQELIAIVIHDWGYWGSEKMDDHRGELHPIWAADIMYRIGGWSAHDLVKYHSRYLARRCGVRASKLCLPDKLGVALMPTWLGVGLGRLTGEIWEYMGEEKYVVDDPSHLERWSPTTHFERYKLFTLAWVFGLKPLEPWRQTVPPWSNIANFYPITKLLTSTTGRGSTGPVQSMEPIKLEDK